MATDREDLTIGAVCEDVATRRAAQLHKQRCRPGLHAVICQHTAATTSHTSFTCGRIVTLPYLERARRFGRAAASHLPPDHRQMQRAARRGDQHGGDLLVVVDQVAPTHEPRLVVIHATS